jgi:fatty-acyl-CoA synthase
MQTPGAPIDLPRRGCNQHRYTASNLSPDGKASITALSGGENIFPREIEDALHKHPGIGDAAVLGLPDERWGEQVVACVRPVPGTEPDVEGWIGHLRARLAGQKMPKRWYVTDSMPLTPSGKIQKFRIRDQITAGSLAELVQ